MSQSFEQFKFTTPRQKFEKFTHSRGKVLWLFGPSGVGKSTLSNAIQTYLMHEENTLCCLLDGDTFRNGLSKDLGLSLEDRSENIRRGAEVAKMFIQHGLFTLCAFITPLEEQRQIIKKILGDDVHFIFVDAPLNVLQERDPKGLYQKAKNNQLTQMSGLDQLFEAPKLQHKKITTDNQTIHATCLEILHYIKQSGLVYANATHDVDH